jgi:zinc transporter ZupT
MGLNADQWHILCLCLFPVIVLSGISLAVLLGSKKGSKLWFTLGVMFSSGILFSGAVVHSLPEASEKFEGLLADDDNNISRLLRWLQRAVLEEEEEEEDAIFPWGGTVFGLSFLFLMCIEAFAERAIDKYIGNQEGNFYGGAHHHDAGKEEHEGKDVTEIHAGAKPEQAVVKDSPETSDADPSVPADATKEGTVLVRAGTAAIRGNGRRRSSVMQSFLAIDKGGTVPDTFLVTARRPSVIGVVVAHDQKDVDEKQTVNPWVSILLLIVLSVHVLLEGLTLGSDDDPVSIRNNFIAVVFHKGFSAFALGSSFITSGYWDKERPGGRKMFYILTLVYVSMDIIGISVGIAISGAFDEDSYGSAILTAMLGGSFLFVAVVELIPGELEKMRAFQLPVFPVMAALLAGFSAMTVIAHWG